MGTASFITRSAGLPAWTLGAAAVALFVGLLLAFVQVLQAGVAQGTLRRQATLEHADAQWRCARVPRPQARAECRTRLRDEASSPPITVN